MTTRLFFSALALSACLSGALLPALCQPGGEGQPANPTGQATAAPGQPVMIPSSGSGQAGVGYAAPGKVVDMRKVKPPKMSEINKLNPGSPSPEEIERLKAFAPGKDFRKEIVNYTAGLSKQPGPPFLQGGTVLFVDDKDLAEQLPEYVFYVLRFRMWPLGFAVPPPLRSNNIFAFDARGKMDLIADPDELNRFFEDRAKNNGAEDAQKRTATAWMALREQLAQDGMYQFMRGEPHALKEGDATAIEIASTVSPQGANRGVLTGKLSFNARGDITDIQQTSSLRPGMRPICQATKLLDSDPIVRKMAEQDLLIMGRAAKPYLDYQRARVSPALQQAIDKIWEQIEADAPH